MVGERSINIMLMLFLSSLLLLLTACEGSEGIRAIPLSEKPILQPQDDLTDPCKEVMCTDGLSCEEGKCVCKGVACGTACLPEGSCCRDSDCEEGICN
ncbi:hypothetical protein D6825_00205, partial [Candidatus Woesearchaeota archaeon]